MCASGSPGKADTHDRSGYTVISTCSEKNSSYVKSLGADKVFDYREPEVGFKIRAFTQNQLRLAWDAISTVESARICAEALSSEPAGCRYASFLENKSPRSDITSIGTNLYTIWGEFFKTGDREYPASKDDFSWAEEFMARAEGLIARGEVKPHRETRRENGLQGVVQGLEDLKNGSVSGEKLVYRVEDTPRLA